MFIHGASICEDLEGVKRMKGKKITPVQRVFGFLMSFLFFIQASQNWMEERMVSFFLYGVGAVLLLIYSISFRVKKKRNETSYLIKETADQGSLIYFPSMYYTIISIHMKCTAFLNFVIEHFRDRVNPDLTF
jgi:glucose uptake protein GlcU